LEETDWPITASWDKLYDVNPAAGAATEIGDLNLSDVVGLAFNPETNTLFGADYNSPAAHWGGAEDTMLS
jgi:hypothetical protein